MEIDTALKELEEALVKIKENYAESDEFKILNYIHGDTHKTGQVIIVTYYDENSKLKYRMNDKKLQNLCNSFVNECRLPDVDDRKVNYMIDYIAENSKNIMNRDDVVDFLKRKAAALNSQAWITSKLKYKFNIAEEKCTQVHCGDRDGVFYIMLCAVNLSEDGLILAIEDRLNEYLGVTKEKQEETEEEEEEKDEDLEKSENALPELQETQEKTHKLKEKFDSEIDLKITEIEEKAAKVNENITQEQAQEEPVDDQEKEEKVAPKVRRPGGFFGPVIKTEDELREENRELWSKYHDSQKEIRSLCEEIDVLKNDIVKDNLTISKKVNVIKSQEQQIQNQASEIESLKEEIDNLNYDILALNDTIANNKDKIEEQSERIKALTQKNEKLTNDLASARATLDNTAKELQATKISKMKDEEDVDLRIAELEMKINEVKAEGISESQELRNKIKDLQHIIDKKNAELRDLKES